MAKQESTESAYTPFVTIVMPAFNEEKYLEKTLKTVRKLDYPKDKMEVIVADDKSTDRTVQIARKYADKIATSGLHRIGANRDAGARLASKKSEILVFFDCDSIVPRDYLRKITAPYTDPRVVGAQGPVYPIEGDFIANLFSKTILPAYLALAAAIGRPSGPGSNFSARTSAYKKVGGFNRNLKTYEDLDLAMRLNKVGKYVYINKAFLYVSMRRVKKWGSARYFLFHVGNMIRFNLLGRSSESYEDVR